jgi:hypothetical protein
MQRGAMTFRKFRPGDRVRVLHTHFLSELRGKVGTIEVCPIQESEMNLNGGITNPTISYWVVFVEPGNELEVGEIDAGLISEADLEFEVS